MHSILGRGSFSTNIPTSVRCGMEVVSDLALLRHYWAFSSSLLLDRLFLIFLLKIWLLVHLFLLNFFLSVNFAFNMLWYSTLWRASPFSNDLLWLTLFMEGFNVRLLDHFQVSSLPHYFSFKEQEIPGNLYCMDGHLMKLKCKLSNILRYRIFDFHVL